MSSREAEGMRRSKAVFKDKQSVTASAVRSDEGEVRDIEQGDLQAVTDGECGENEGGRGDVASRQGGLFL